MDDIVVQHEQFSFCLPNVRVSTLNVINIINFAMRQLLAEARELFYLTAKAFTFKFNFTLATTLFLFPSTKKQSMRDMHASFSITIRRIQEFMSFQYCF